MRITIYGEFTPESMKILSSIIMISWTSAEYLFGVSYVVGEFKATQSGQQRSDTLKQAMGIYGIFLCSQLLGLLISHNVLEWKARQQLPKGKAHHVHFLVSSGLAHDTVSSANVVERLMRNAFLRLVVERKVKQAGARQQSRSRDAAAMQSLALAQELQRRRIRESCTMVLFVDSSFEARSNPAADRMHCALKEGIPVFVVTEKAYVGQVRRELSSIFDKGLPHGMHLVDLGDSLGGVSRTTDQIIECVDGIVEAVDRPQVDRPARARGLTVVDKRKIERQVGVRGGMMALLQPLERKDPHFKFRLVATLWILYGMQKLAILGGGSFDDADFLAKCENSTGLGDYFGT